MQSYFIKYSFSQKYLLRMILVAESFLSVLSSMVISESSTYLYLGDIFILVRGK